MVLVGVAGDERAGHRRIDNRLVGWQDVMPTLLDLAGFQISGTVEGLSMVGPEKREWFYGEWGEGPVAPRMIHDGRFKLIYYATGNRFQLFDLQEDPHELNELAASPDQDGVPGRMLELLRGELYGGDEAWVQNGELDRC